MQEANRGSVRTGDEAGCLLRVQLPVALTNGNDGRTKHWYRPAQQRKSFERLLVDKHREPFDVPVVVHVTRVLSKGQRKWDSSSGLRGNYKELEDALVAVGWFVDDSPKWIRETRFFQDDTRRTDGPAVVIEVFAAESDQ